MKVFIVLKKDLDSVVVEGLPGYFLVHEGIFTTKEKAKDYIESHKGSASREDFVIKEDTLDKK